MADCVCEGSNDVAGYTPSGYPHDKDGLLLTHLLTAEQRRELELHLQRNRTLSQALTVGFLGKRQAQ